MTGPRVVISGLGFVTSIGLGRPAVLASLLRLRSGIARGETCLAGTIKGFAADRRPPPEAYAQSALDEALADARMDRAELARGEGALWCAAPGPLAEMLAAHFGIRGPVGGADLPCSSRVLAAAFEEIRAGRQQKIMVVGTGEMTAEARAVWPSRGALSRRADPARASRPFDLGSDGFVGTGGAVALVLETSGSALERSVTPYAELLGWGRADGASAVEADPEGAGLASAMGRALICAGVEAAEIDYVNAHATSAPAEDATEARALHAVFTARGARPAISSTKALTGYGMAMAGAMETAFCALSLKEGFVPGGANLEHPHPACDGLNLPRLTVARPLRFVLKNSGGEGGGAVCLVLGKAR